MLRGAIEREEVRPAMAATAGPRRAHARQGVPGNRRLRAQAMQRDALDGVMGGRAQALVRPPSPDARARRRRPAKGSTARRSAG